MNEFSGTLQGKRPVRVRMQHPTPGLKGGGKEGEVEGGGHGT